MSRPLQKIASLDEAIALLTDVQAYHEKVSEGFKELADQDGQVEQHRYVRDCLAIRAYLEALQSKQRGSGLELLPEDLEGLPPELIAELSISDGDQQEIDIMKLIEAEGGTISLDLLLVRWYRAKKSIIKRKALTSRLYRMQQKGRIFSVEGAKGIYTLQAGNARGVPAHDGAEGESAS